MRGNKFLISRIVILFLVFLNLQTQCQTRLASKDFKNKQWATSNLDNMFYKADTIRMVRTSESIKSAEKNQPRLSLYFKSANCIIIDFLNREKLHLGELDVAAWSVRRNDGIYSWKFIKSKQRLILYFNGKMLSCFQALSSRFVNIESSYTYIPVYKATEITFYRCKIKIFIPGF